MIMKAVLLILGSTRLFECRMRKIANELWYGIACAIYSAVVQMLH
jgi:hypothetical protein